MGVAFTPGRVGEKGGRGMDWQDWEGWQGRRHGPQGLGEEMLVRGKEGMGFTGGTG